MVQREFGFQLARDANLRKTSYEREKACYVSIPHECQYTSTSDGTYHRSRVFPACLTDKLWPFALGFVRVALILLSSSFGDYDNVLATAAAPAAPSLLFTAACLTDLDVDVYSP